MYDVTQDYAPALLTAPLFFRSNVNYVPPPEEVSLFLNSFIFSL